MVGTRNIETVSFLFGAGVAIGTLIRGSGVLAPGGLLLGIAACLAIGREHWPGILTAFLLCGMFCALNDAAILPSLPWAETAVAALRERIDRLPFASPRTAPLLKALVTGDRGGLDRETVQVFRNSGASHLLALSGLHIGILYMLLDRSTWIFGRTPATRRIRSECTILLAGFYALMTGASPSIVRAFLFITINEIQRLLNRRASSLQVLSLALLVQLVLCPSAIRSTGFQLSYLAMAGIFLLYPRLRDWYPEGRRPDPVRWIWRTAALSLSCQVFTGPLAWYRFRTFPPWFLLTNLLAIPLTTSIMACALFTLATGWACGLTDRLCNMLLWVLEIISTM